MSTARARRRRGKRWHGQLCWALAVARARCTRLVLAAIHCRCTDQMKNASAPRAISSAAHGHGRAMPMLTADTSTRQSQASSARAPRQPRPGLDALVSMLPHNRANHVLNILGGAPQQRDWGQPLGLRSRAQSWADCHVSVALAALERGASKCSDETLTRPWSTSAHITPLGLDITVDIGNDDLINSPQYCLDKDDAFLRFDPSRALEDRTIQDETQLFFKHHALEAAATHPLLRKTPDTKVDSFALKWSRKVPATLVEATTHQPLCRFALPSLVQEKQSA